MIMKGNIIYKNAVVPQCGEGAAEPLLINGLKNNGLARSVSLDIPSVFLQQQHIRLATGYQRDEKKYNKGNLLHKSNKRRDRSIALADAVFEKYDPVKQSDPEGDQDGAGYFVNDIQVVNR